MRTKATTIALVMVFALGTLGCSTYYRITDPTTGDVYYTNEVSTRKGGAVSFSDARTGAEITIQNSEVIKVSKQEYRQAKKGVLPTSAQPVQPASPSKP